MQRIYQRLAPRYRYLFLIFIILALLAVIVAYQQSTTTIQIDVNGTTYRVETRAQTVGEALDEADVYLDAADRVNPSREAPVRDDMTINITRARQLVLEINGVVQRIYTHETAPLRILDEQGITLNPADQLFVNYVPLQSITNVNDIQPIRNLRIIRSKPFTVRIDGELHSSGESTARTVGELLAERNIELYLADRIQPTPLAVLEAGQTITIQRSSTVQIQVDERDINTRAVGATINDVLNNIGLPLSGQDYTIPDASETFVPGMTIRIIRVLEQLERQQEAIPFETVTIPDPSLPAGTVTVVQQGQSGLRETTLRIRQEDGYVVSRSTQAPWIVIPPVTEIIAFGTAED